MKTRHFVRNLAAVVLGTVLLAGGTVPVRGALMITFSGANPTTIKDTDPGQKPGEIIFGLTTDQGYGVSGTLIAQSGPGFSRVSLVVLQANYLLGAPGGALTVTFQDTFNGPPAPVVATDAVTAFFSNIYGSNQIGGLDSLQEGAFVGNKFINPITSSGNNGPITFNPPAGNFSAIADGHGPALLTMGGPPWTLEGSFMFTLGARAAAVPGFPGDSLTYSQTVQIATVPEPPTVVPFGLGLGLGLLGVAIHLGRREAVHSRRLRIGGNGA